MQSVHIHIDETLDAEELLDLRSELCEHPHVADVEASEFEPHDLVVEYDESHIHPMDVAQRLQYHGVHCDVTAC